MNKCFLQVFAVATVFSLIFTTAKADVITDWNQIAINATRKAGQNTNLASRIVAIEAAAVYDAVNAIKQQGSSFHYKEKADKGASAQAAAVQAAHDVLVKYFPDQKKSLDSLLTVSLKTATDGDVKAGQSVGSASAADIIALRASDGSSPNTTYKGPAKPAIGQWMPTPDAMAPGANYQWGKVQPFVMATGNQFRPKAPPAVGSAEYNKDLAEVRSLGSIKSTTRTADQTHQAQFYKQDADITVNEATRVMVIMHRMPIWQSAVVFVQVDLAVADARIAVSDASYQYLEWRPVTAINADSITGKVTNNYSKWTPLCTTPASPAYPSGHATTITAGFEVLKQFFGDNINYELQTTTPGEPSRKLASFTGAESEAALSRVYAGDHFAHDVNTGKDLGMQISNYIIVNGPHITSFK